MKHTTLASTQDIEYIRAKANGIEAWFQCIVVKPDHHVIVDMTFFYRSTWVNRVVLKPSISIPDDADQLGLRAATVSDPGQDVVLISHTDKEGVEVQFHCRIPDPGNHLDLESEGTYDMVFCIFATDFEFKSPGREGFPFGDMMLADESLIAVGPFDYLMTEDKKEETLSNLLVTGRIMSRDVVKNPYTGRTFHLFHLHSRGLDFAVVVDNPKDIRGPLDGDHAKAIGLTMGDLPH